jgi:hypothetical protein
VGVGGNQTNTMNQSYCTQGATGLAVGNGSIMYSSQSFYGPDISHAILTASNSILNEDSDVVEPECNFGIQISGKHNVTKSQMFQSAGTPLLYLDIAPTVTTLEMSSISNTAGAGVAVGGNVAGTGILNVQGGPSSGNTIANGTICPGAICTAVAMHSETQAGTCVANAATITFKEPYRFAPLAAAMATTSGSTGDQVTATNTTTATVHCNGATDAFVVMVTPNPI